jgi:hypothetical protein
MAIVQYYVVIFLLLTFQRIVHLKQCYIRQRYNQPEPMYSTLFASITWHHMDMDMLHCFKYLANFFFYKFGLECCYFITTVAIIVRMDAYAILYGIWLGMFMLLRRKQVANLWIFYLLFLTLIMPMQYFSRLGKNFWSTVLKYGIEEITPFEIRLFFGSR